LGVLLGRSVVVLGGVAATADGPEDGEAGDRYPGRTLVTVQDDTIIVADSETDRFVEYDADSMTESWRFEGPEADDRLRWPRDADRLPAGTR
jgi:hypothetical protein